MGKQSTFDELIIISNIKRILLIGTIYTLFEIVGLTLSTLGFFESDIRLYVAIIVLFHLIYLPTLYTFTYRKTTRNFKVLQYLEWLYFPVIIGWASLFTALIYLQNDDITIYAMILFICSAVFVIRAKTSRLLYGMSIIFFGILIYGFVESIPDANGLLFKSLIVTILAYTIARTNYRIRIELYNKNSELLKLNKELEDRVKRDSLTGLYNNGYAFEYIETALELRRAKNTNLTLMMIDIDDFKKVNDQYGHLEGDIVIQSLANVLTELIDDKDIAARYGGEEFIVVLNDTNLQEASEIGSRILEAVRSLQFTFGSQITISIGVAQCNGDTRETLIKKADEQLYQAKNLGKNQLCNCS